MEIKKMKILVLGANGMAGHLIANYFSEAGHEVVAFSRKPFAGCRNIVGEIMNFNQLESTIKYENPDAIINAVGILNKDADEHRSQAVMLNSYLPHFLADITRTTNIRIIHMSTDCVFSGKTGSYRENDLTDGKTFYDRSKALGELNNSKDLTFRTSIIGPDINENGIGLFNWFMKQEGQILGFQRAIWTGVTTLTLAKAMEKALQQNLKGLYHLVNNQPISKYDLLLLFSKVFGANHSIVIPDAHVQVNKSLVNTRSDFDFIVPSYETMIEEMKNWIVNHQDQYRHYKLQEVKQ